MGTRQKAESQKIEHTCMEITHIGHHSRGPLPWEQMKVVLDWGGYRIEWWGDKAEQAVCELNLREGEWVRIQRAWINITPHANKPGYFGRTLLNVTITLIADCVLLK